MKSQKHCRTVGFFFIIFSDAGFWTKNPSLPPTCPAASVHFKFLPRPRVWRLDISRSQAKNLCCEKCEVYAMMVLTLSASSGQKDKPVTKNLSGATAAYRCSYQMVTLSVGDWHRAEGVEKFANVLTCRFQGVATSHSSGCRVEATDLASFILLRYCRGKWRWCPLRT